MTARVRWIRVQIGPVPWTVYLVPPSDPLLAASDEEEHPNEGFCERSTSTIVINDALPVERRFDVLVHELMHAALFMMSGAESIGITVDQEEAMIGIVAPLVAQALQPFVRIPAPRKGRRR